MVTAREPRHNDHAKLDADDDVKLSNPISPGAGYKYR